MKALKRIKEQLEIGNVVSDLDTSAFDDYDDNSDNLVKCKWAKVRFSPKDVKVLWDGAPVYELPSNEDRFKEECVTPFDFCKV
jgi:hypothetical protein